MPIKSKKYSHKGKGKTRKHKQKVINMIGCSKKHKHSKSCKNLGNPTCPNCGPNCHCGPKCSCPHPCPGSCYLNRRKGLKGGTSLKGGNGCGSCGCPIAPLSVAQMNKFGGSLNNSRSLNGGNFYKPANPIPGPFEGSAWGTSVNKWPAMNGIGSDRNYLSSYANVIGNDPQQQAIEDSGYKTNSSIIGGYRYKKKSTNSKSHSVKSKSMKAGGLVPQDLVNLGRNFSFNLKSAYNSLNGYHRPVSDMPYEDQLTANNQFM